MRLGKTGVDCSSMKAQLGLGLTARYGPKSLRLRDLVRATTAGTGELHGLRLWQV